MRFPRVTIQGLMIATAVIAVDVYLLVMDWVVVFVLLLGLNLGLILILRKPRTQRRFWVGFEVVGLILLGISVGLIRYRGDLVSLWPSTCSNFVLDRLSPTAQDWAAPWLDRLTENYPGESELEMLGWSLVRYETTIGLPLVVLATIGGFFWKLVGPKAKIEPASVENPSQDPGSGTIEASLTRVR
jgi:hypothetical protein